MSPPHARSPPVRDRPCLSGGTPVTLVSGGGPQGIALDVTNVYWADVSGAVKKVALGGGMPVTLASDQPGPVGIAVDATSVYWTNAGSQTITKLAK